MIVLLMLAFLWEIWRTLRRLGGLGLILMGLFDSSVIPTPGGQDALTIVLAAGERDWWPYYAAMATIGSVLGGYLTYKLGKKGGEEALEQRLSKRKRDRVKRIFEKFGFGAVFLPAIMPPPVPMSPFLLSAGAMDYPRSKFLFALTAGRALRFTLVAYFASIYGRQVLKFFADNYMTVTVIAVSLAVIGVLAFFIYRARRKKTGEQAPSPSVG